MRVPPTTPHHSKKEQESATLAVTGAQETLRWWQNQASAIEEDRRKVGFILPAGILLALGFLPFFPRTALSLAALSALATLQGFYLVTVHRWEFAHNVVEAKKELWIAQKKVSDEQGSRVDSPSRTTRGALIAHPRQSTSGCSVFAPKT